MQKKEKGNRKNVGKRKKEKQQNGKTEKRKKTKKEKTCTDGTQLLELSWWLLPSDACTCKARCGGSGSGGLPPLYLHADHIRIAGIQSLAQCAGQCSLCPGFIRAR